MFQGVIYFPLFGAPFAKCRVRKIAKMSTRELAKKALNRLTRNGNGHGKKKGANSKMTRTIEKATSNISSNVFLWAGVACVAAAAILNATGKKSIGKLLSQLGAPVLIMGLYNRKLASSGFPEVAS